MGLLALLATLCQTVGGARKPKLVFRKRMQRTFVVVILASKVWLPSAL